MLDHTPTLEKLSLDFFKDDFPKKSHKDGLNDGFYNDNEPLDGKSWVDLSACIGRHNGLTGVSIKSFPWESEEHIRCGMAAMVASSSLTYYKHWESMWDCYGYSTLLGLVPLLTTERKLEKLYIGEICLRLEGSQKVITLLRSNYTITQLEIQYAVVGVGDLPIVHRFHKMAEIILTLNRYGRRYMAEDRGSKEKGVALLAEVAAQNIICTFPYGGKKAEDISLDCIFFHLSENPSLCDSIDVSYQASMRQRFERM